MKNEIDVKLETYAIGRTVKDGESHQNAIDLCTHHLKMTHPEIVICGVLETPGPDNTTMIEVSGTVAKVA